MEKKKIFCVWVSLLLIFTSCSSDELGEVKQKKDFTPQYSALAEHADSYLSKIIDKYKNEIDTIYNYEEDMNPSNNKFLGFFIFRKTKSLIIRFFLFFTVKLRGGFSLLMKLPNQN